tara:strand:- start:1650 stop:2381 length:732 start_codon:yes stop_codon:yes gene_type:complete
MNKYPELSILLTGAIDIEHTPLALSVPKNIRLNEYIKSISFMLKKYKNLNFVYVDSSNYNLKLKNPEFKKFSNFESLALPAQDVVNKNGKGAGELLSINYALDNSVLLRNRNYIIKINGRYKLLNLEKIIQKINFKNKNSIIYGEFRSFNSWFDSRCFLAKKEIFKELTKYKIDEFNGFFFEHALANLVNYHLSKNLSEWRMFQRKPKFIGTSGWDGKNLKSNIFKSLIIDLYYFLKSKIISL